MSGKTRRVLKSIRSLIICFLIITGLFAFLSWDILNGISVAAAFMIMLIWHECGHLLTAKIIGAQIWDLGFDLRGGYSEIEIPLELRKFYAITYGGPFAGLVLCAVAFVVYLAGYFHPFNIGIGTSALLMIYSDLAICIFAFFNLFNLLPVYPMDGRLILAALIFNGQKSINAEKTIPLNAKPFTVKQKIIGWCAYVGLIVVFILCLFAFAPSVVGQYV